MRQHLEAVERQTGHRPEKLDAGRIPDCFLRIVQIWGDLDDWRGAGFAGPQRLSWADFRAYAEMTGTRLTHNDLIGLEIMEAAFFAARAESTRGGS